MQRKGAVPIPYIIALLLGIAVVAIIGYWFFVLGGEWGGETSLQSCKTDAYTYCAGWQALGYTGGDEPTVGWFGDRYPACRAYQTQMGFSTWQEDNSDSGDVQEDADACKALLGIGSTSTTLGEA